MSPKDGDLTHPLGSLFQYLTTVALNIFLPWYNWNFLCFNFSLLSLCISDNCFLYNLPLGVWRCLLSCLFKTAQFSCIMCSSSLILVTISWTCSSMVRSFSYQEPKDGHSIQEQSYMYWVREINFNYFKGIPLISVQFVVCQDLQVYFC